MMEWSGHGFLCVYVCMCVDYRCLSHGQVFYIVRVSDVGGCMSENGVVLPKGIDYRICVCDRGGGLVCVVRREVIVR